MRRTFAGLALSFLLALPLTASIAQSSGAPLPSATPILPDATYRLLDPFDYADVLLLGNNNSQVSRNLTSYFATLHQIPANQVMFADLPDAESITEAQWNSFAAWFTGELSNRSLGPGINYIVTFKGIPIRVYWTSPGGPSSFQDALMLLGGSMAGAVGDANLYANPYFNRSERFTFAQFGFRLVTGIYAYNESTARALIDRAANSLGSRGEFVLDADASKGYSNSHGTYGWANSALVWANATLTGQGLPTYLDTNNTYVTGRSNVMGYSSWGSNDCCWGSVTQVALPHNTWLNGSIGETFVSTGARTFTWPPSYGQSLIADWIDEGANGMKGYTDEPYINAIADGHILYGRYIRGYNLAESYWSASHFVGWRQIVIGDPKMAPYADLTDLSVNGTLLGVPSTATQFGTLNVTLGIDNTGAVDRETDVRFDFDGQPVATVTVSVPAHAAASYSIALDLSGLPAATWGSGSLAVAVDPDDAIPELVEGNNAVARTLDIRRAPIASAALERMSVLTFEPVNLTLTALRADRPIDHFEVSVDGGLPQTVAAASDSAVLSVSFSRSGSHQFEAVAVDIAGLRSATTLPATVSILNRRPIVSLATNETAPLSLVPVDFNASSSYDPDGTIASFAWDAATVGSGTGSQVTLVFPRPGVYRVSFAATDDEGARETGFVDVQVGNRAPIPVVTANVTNTTTLLPIAFASASQDPDGEIVLYSFGFDDGVFENVSVPQVVHSFLTPGVLGVWLEVTDDWGATARVHLSVTVSNRPPVLEWAQTNPSTVPEGSSTTFVASAVDLDSQLASYTFDYGDGQRISRAPSGTIRETHTYSSEGNFTIRLTATDEFGGVSTITAVVEVLHPAPVVSSGSAVINGSSLTVSYLVISPYPTLEMEIEIDGVVVRREAINPSGTFRTSLPELAAGNHTLRVSVTDGTKTTLLESSTFEVAAPPVPPPPPPPPTQVANQSMLLYGMLAAAAAGAVAVVVLLSRRGRAK